VDNEKAKRILLLLLRLWFGFTMMENGKFIFDSSQTSFFLDWFGKDLNFPAPLLMYYLAKGSEFFGGLFLFAGVFTRIAGVLVAFTMLIATLTANIHQVYDGDGAITISFFLFAVSFIFSGPGKWSIGYLFFKDKMKGLLV
jgi:uncharacterized membrane protein YphA (DoxX/SURF4 family)